MTDNTNFKALVYQRTIVDAGETEIVLMRDGTYLIGGEEGWFKPACLFHEGAPCFGSPALWATAEQAYTRPDAYIDN